GDSNRIGCHDARRGSLLGTSPRGRRRVTAELCERRDLAASRRPPERTIAAGGFERREGVLELRLAALEPGEGALEPGRDRPVAAELRPRELQLLAQHLRQIPPWVVDQLGGLVEREPELLPDEDLGQALPFGAPVEPDARVRSPARPQHADLVVVPERSR